MVQGAEATPERAGKITLVSRIPHGDRDVPEGSLGRSVWMWLSPSLCLVGGAWDVGQPRLHDCGQSHAVGADIEGDS